MHTVMLISLVAGGYVFLRAVVPLGLRWWWKAALGIIIGVAASSFKVMQLLGGGMLFAPDMPAWAILVITWLYLLLMAYFLLLLGAGLLEGCAYLLPLWRKAGKDARRGILRHTHLILLGVAALVCSVGMHNALCAPEIKMLTIPSDTPLRLALLSDLHADAVKDSGHMRTIVERTNALKPDAVLITGDFVDGTVAQRGNNLTPLRDLQAPLGVYGVPGNHDYFSGYEEWLPFLRSLGIRMLNNEHVILGEPGIVLAGVTDPAARLFGKEKPDVEKALAGAPAGRMVILLAHQPQLALQAQKHGVAVQLSGHTHGGQMPGFADLTAAFNHGWVSGSYALPHMLLYVSNGTSLWTGMPLRLGVPSEITVLTLTPPEANTAP